MKSSKARWGCGAALAIVLIGVLFLLANWNNEPQYQGKSASRWIRDYEPVQVGGTYQTNVYLSRGPGGPMVFLPGGPAGASVRPNVAPIAVGQAGSRRIPSGWVTTTNVVIVGAKTTYPARDALSAIGSAAVPYVQEALHADDNVWTLQYRKWFPKLQRVFGKAAPLPQPLSQQIRLRAALAIGDLHLKDAATNLVGVFDDSDPIVRRQARASLRKFRWYEEPIASALDNFLRNERRIDLTMETVTELRMDNPAAIAVLVQALQTPPPAFQLQAAQSLSYAREKAEAAVPALIGSLNSTDQQLVEAALRALEAIGPGAKAAVPALRAALDSSPSETRYLAARALASMCPEVESACAALEAALQNKNDMVRTVASRELSRGAEGK